MTFPPQDTGYRESQYERPNQAWVCGWAADGRPCRLGPDRKGRCPARDEAMCTPRKNEAGNRYHCTRLEVSGGPCTPGPLPDGRCCRPEPEHPVCQPRLSLRARRGRLVVTTGVAAIGALFGLLTGPWSWEAASPGDLARAHLGIEASSGSCAACHSAGERGRLAWVEMAFIGPGRVTESDKCLGCHFRDAVSECHDDLLQPHGVSRDGLAGRLAGHQTWPESSGTLALTLASLAGGAPPAPIGCAVCHHEHRGPDHDLTAMDDTRCQVCHQHRFASFSRGHPPFRTTPPAGPGILFDHVSHRTRHFGERGFDCARCHALDAAGGAMTLRPFESSCAECHDEQIRMKARPVVVLQLPLLDLDVEEDGDAAYYWPDEGFEATKLPPVMRLLLSGDEQAAQLPPLDVGTDELDNASKRALASAAKRLVHELLLEDPRPRLARALGLPEQTPAVNAVAAQLRQAGGAVLALQETWLPALEADLEGREIEPAEAPDEQDEQEDRYHDAKLYGWHHDEYGAAVAYTADRHADPFVTAWIDALAAAPADARRRDVREALIAGLGACMKCHIAGRWRPADRADFLLGYNRTLRHDTHLRALAGVLAPANQDCGHCHRPAPAEGAPWHGYETYDQAMCASCHTPGRADDRCLTCHTYHVIPAVTR